MKHKNTEDYYNEKSKESKFAPSFDNLSASAKNHWEREFDKYIRNNTPIELEDGCVYQFEFEDIIRYGKFNAPAYFEDHFNEKSLVVGIEHCTNIVKLVPEVK